MTTSISTRMAGLLLVVCAAGAPLAYGRTMLHPPRPAAVSVDGRAMTILEKSEKTTLGLKTYEAKCSTILFYPARGTRPAHERREYSWLLAAKPNLMRYDKWYLRRDAKTGRWTRNVKTFGETFVCDGKTDWKQFGRTYRTDNFTRPEYLEPLLEPWEGFYSSAMSPHGMIVFEQKQGELREFRYDGSEPVNGVWCDKIFSHIKAGDGGEAQEYWTTLYIGRDGLVRREVSRVGFGGKPGFTRVATIRNIRLNEPIAASVFKYTPPKGVVSEAEEARLHPPPALLANGAAAPDFMALDSQNKPVRLSDYKGKQVVVLDFWASWCGPCVASMPHNQATTKKLQAEGLPVILLAVDNSEERDAFSAWVKAKRKELSAITFAHIPPKNDVSGKLFHVTGIPTQYVIDKDGIIRASFVGYGGPTNDLEKAVRGALDANTH